MNLTCNLELIYEVLFFVSLYFQTNIYIVRPKIILVPKKVPSLVEIKKKLWVLLKKY